MKKKMIRITKILYFFSTIIITFILYPLSIIYHIDIYIPFANISTTHIFYNIFLGINFIIAFNVFFKKILEDDRKYFTIFIGVITVGATLITFFTNIFTLDGKYYKFTSPNNKYEIVMNETGIGLTAYKKEGFFIKEDRKIISDITNYGILRDNQFRIEWKENIMTFIYTLDSYNEDEYKYYEIFEF